MLYTFLLASHKREELKIIRGRLHQLCWNLNGSVRAELFLKLGRMTFNKAVQYQESGRAGESLHLLKDNHLNIEEAKKNSMRNCKRLSSWKKTTLCIPLSANRLWLGKEATNSGKKATCDEENIQMELVWDAVDCYVQSIVLCRGKCLESEAIAHSQLGRLYESIVMNVKSREHYKFTVDLVIAMAPKNFNSRSWYNQALSGLNKFQQGQRWKETKEKERLRGPILAELKDDLDELKKASAKSSQALLDIIYSKHPPKRGDKSADS